MSSVADAAQYTVKIFVYPSVDATWARASLIRLVTDTNLYGTGSVKNTENSPQNSRGYTDIFTVYGCCC